MQGYIGGKGRNGVRSLLVPRRIVLDKGWSVADGHRCSLLIVSLYSLLPIVDGACGSRTRRVATTALVRLGGLDLTALAIWIVAATTGNRQGKALDTVAQEIPEEKGCRRARRTWPRRAIAACGLPSSLP